MRSFLKTLLQRRGYELASLYPDERNRLPGDLTFSYREALYYIGSSLAGQISLDEAQLLADLVRSSDPSRPIVEVGTLFGHSTMVLAMAKRREQRLFTVDNYFWNPLGVRPQVHRAITRGRLKQAVDEHNVVIKDCSASEFYASYAEPPPALFFCDADHSYEAVHADLTWALQVGATIICGDDYEPKYHPGVVRAVDELGGAERLSGGLYVLKR